MKSKGGFFSKLVTFFLVVIIIGGIGFLGYSFWKNGKLGTNMSMNMPGMNMPSNSSQSKQSDNNMNMGKDTKSDTSQNQMDMSKDNNKDSNSSSDNNALNNVNLLLQDKQSLDKVIASLNDSLSLMTMDPYGVDSKNQGINANNQQTQNGQTNPQNGTTTQGNTTVNVYPQGNNAPNGNMGIAYDQSKMEQLHTGLYKVSIGIQLLGQLKDGISSQIEQAQLDVKDPAKYYSNQYYLAMQNKNKLNEALGYVNQATNVLNINPYIAPNGSVYDKDKMEKVHESVFKFGQTVIELNKLNDSLTNHTVYFGTLAQNYSGTNQMNNGSMNMPGMSGGIFGNLNLTSIVNIILILFISLFIMGIAGLIFSLLKPSKVQGDNK